MPQWNRAEYEGQATKLAEAFVAAGTSADLNTMVLKVARENCLNPQQIDTLVHLVNTRVFNAKFASMKDAPDRLVDFQVIRSEDIVAALDPATKTAEKVASEQFPDLADELRPYRGGVYPPEAAPTVEKLAASIETLLGPRETPAVLALRYAKVAEDLGMDVRRLQIRYNDLIGQLKTAQRRVYFDFDRFESSAVAKLGSAVLPELQLLRRARHAPELDATAEKIAAVVDQLVENPLPENQLLARAVETRAKLAEVEGALPVAQKRAADYRREVMRRD